MTKTMAISASHVSRALKEAHFDKYAEEGSAIRGYKRRYTGFKVSTSGANATVTYALGNDFGGREFRNNQWVVREARSNTISEKVEQYEKILIRAGYIVENHGEYLAVTGRTN